MADKEKTYEELRAEVLKIYKTLYKESVAMDYCRVSKEVRIRMLEDPVFIMETKAIKAGLFVEQLDLLTNVISGTYDNSEKGTDRSPTILKAMELKQKLLLEDLEANRDESKALNVAYIAMSKEDFEALETAEVNQGGNSREIGADFGVNDDTDSFEARLKADAKERLKKLESENNSKEGE